MANLIGHRLGQYEITAVLGKGGMATVYRARQTTIQREVAVKVIKPDLAETGEFIQRFRREAETIAALRQPHILKLFDYGEEGDLVYLVMDLLTGGSLADLIRHGPLSQTVAARALDQIASGLDYAHRQGVIHRDLKPQNVLLDEDGNAYLTDFGIAKLLSETTALTQSGVAMGTPAYMSPEQWQGQILDGRADIYALGVMFFEMLAGRLPFIADTPFSMLNMHVNVPPPPILDLRADLPTGVEGVVQKALAKRREERFSSAGELATAFRAALAGQIPVMDDFTNRLALNADAKAPTPPSHETPSPLARSRRPLVWIIGIVVGILILIGISVPLLSGKVTPTATISPSLTTQSQAATQSVAVPSFTSVVKEATATVANQTIVTGRPSATTQAPIPTQVVVLPSLTPTQTPSVSPTVDFAAAALTFDALSTQAVKATSLAQTQTQSAAQTATATRWTLTPSSTYTLTPNITASFAAYLTQRAQTQAAQEALNQTATATLWTLTPTLTLTPSKTAAVTLTPTATPFPTVPANNQWTPQTRSFDGVEMVLVPPGCFMMGSTDGSANEKPVNKQCFDVQFWIDKYEVTQGQFKQFNGVATQASYFKGDKRPVERITWFEARDFCEKRGTRLPTEAEWEYAARGPDNLVFPWGDTFVRDNGVFSYNSKGQTVEVGSKLKGVSWVGAFDLSGNVFEWVSSIYQPYPYNKDDGRESIDDTESSRMLRGGSWIDAESSLFRAAYRGVISPSTGSVSLGFRCLRSF